jgi:hypothetical protein
MLKNILILGIIVLFAGIGFFVAGSIPQTESYVETVPTQVTKPVQVTVPFETTKPAEVIEYGISTGITLWDVEWRTITGEGKWGAPVGHSTFPPTFTYDWGYGEVYGGYKDYIGFIATAKIYVSRSGPVSFTVGANERAELYLNDKKIIDTWEYNITTTIYETVTLTLTLPPFDQYREKTTVINMNPAEYTLKLVYYEITGSAKVSFYADPDVLSWTKTIHTTRTTYTITTLQRIDTTYVINTEYTGVTKQRAVADERLQTLGLVITSVGIGMIIASVGIILMTRRRPAS